MRGALVFLILYFQSAANDAAKTFSPVLMTNDIYTPGFVVAHPEICPNGGENMKLLILVPSKPSNSAERYAIRSNWGRFSDRKLVSVAFVLGQPPKGSDAKHILDEELSERDVIIGRFADTYRNLTLKTLSMLEWADTYCPLVPRILKAEDDSFVNVPRLLSFIKNTINSSYTIWGNVGPHNPPIRSKSNKNYISRDQFSENTYPNYASGPTYLMTSDIIKQIFNIALNLPYIHLEDVFITGIVANSLQIPREDVERFCIEKNKKQPCYQQNAFTVKNIKPKDQYDMMKTILSGKCGKRKKA